MKIVHYFSRNMMVLKHSILLTTSLMGIVLLLAGCWDRKEVENLALVTAAGLDKIDDKNIELSIQLFLPKSGGGQQGAGSSSGGGSADQTMVRSAVGVTVADAMSRLQEKLPRQIFWGHIDILIISEKLAKKGIREYVDFFVRYPETRERLNVYISKVKVKDVLELQPPLEHTSAEVLKEMAHFKTGLGVTLKDLAEMLTNEAAAVILPLIQILPHEPNKDKMKTIAFMKGTAVFRKDKMIGRIDDQKTRGIMLLRNELKSTDVTIATDESEGFVSLKLLKTKTHLIPQIKDEKWSVKIKVETEGNVIENTTKLNLTVPKFVKGVEKDLNLYIEKLIDAALYEGQTKMKADIFRFNEAFYRKYPKKWKSTKDRWAEVYPKVEVSVEVKAKILSSGLSAAGAIRPEKEVKKK